MYALHIDIYRVYLKISLIIDILLLIIIFAPLSSCHAKETPTYISTGEHMFSCNFDESQF